MYGSCRRYADCESRCLLIVRTHLRLSRTDCHRNITVRSRRVLEMHLFLYCTWQLHFDAILPAGKGKSPSRSFAAFSLQPTWIHKKSTSIPYLYNSSVARVPLVPCIYRDRDRDTLSLGCGPDSRIWLANCIFTSCHNCACVVRRVW